MRLTSSRRMASSRAATARPIGSEQFGNFDARGCASKTGQRAEKGTQLESITSCVPFSSPRPQPPLAPPDRSSLVGRSVSHHVILSIGSGKSNASGISCESVAIVTSGNRPSRSPERGVRRGTIHAGWRKLRQSADSLTSRMQRKRRQPPDPARPASLEPATPDRRRLGGEKVTKQSQNSKNGSH